jgi:hypothetical protein
VLGLFGKRLIDLSVLFLALYAFAFVPLGKHTGLEHARRIFTTPAAKSAGRDVAGAVERLRARLLSGDDAAPKAEGRPVVPKLPKGKPPADLMVAPRALEGAPDASL